MDKLPHSLLVSNTDSIREIIPTIVHVIPPIGTQSLVEIEFLPNFNYQPLIPYEKT